MKTTIADRVVPALALALVATIAIAQPPAIATSDPTAEAVRTGHRAGGLRGVWDSVVTLQACGSGITLRTFRALNLFERDGGLVATSEVAQPPSLGRWQWLGGASFRAQFRLQRFGAGSVFEGVNEVTREIELASGGEQFTSKVSVSVYDISGTLIAQTCGKEVATRVF